MTDRIEEGPLIGAYWHHAEPVRPLQKVEMLERFLWPRISVSESTCGNRSTKRRRGSSIGACLVWSPGRNSGSIVELGWVGLGRPDDLGDTSDAGILQPEWAKKKRSPGSILSIQLRAR